jgi:hypothetical protein
MELLDCELPVMVFLAHLQCSAVVAIVNCPDRGQPNAFRSPKPVVPQLIWLFQESQNKNFFMLIGLPIQGIYRQLVIALASFSLNSIQQKFSSPNCV